MVDNTKMYQDLLDDYKKKKSFKGFWKAQTGKNYLRFLPNWKCEPGAVFFRKTGYHYNLGPAKDKVVVCLKAEGYDKCPVCEMVHQLYSTKNKEDAAIAKSIKLSERYIYNIVDLNDKEKGVQVFASGPDVWSQLIKFCGNTKYGDVTDPQLGRNIELTLTPGEQTKNGYPKYDVMPDPGTTEIESADWLADMKDLDELVKPVSAEEMEELMILGKSEPKESKPVPEPVEAPAVSQPAATPAPAGVVSGPAAVEAPKGKLSVADMLKQLREERKK